MKLGYDVIGDIVIFKFDYNLSEKEKRDIAFKFFEEHKNVRTALEKTDKIKGRLRIAKTRFILGVDKRETVHIENGCRFKLNIDETYFSPRLSNQRQEVASDIVKKVNRKKNKILVLFAGVGPFSIVVAKKLKLAGKKALIVSNELNRKACQYACENVRINKVEDYVNVVQGDAKKIAVKLKKLNLPLKYDFVIMPRPNLKDTFLKEMGRMANKGAKFYYHGFGKKEEVVREIKNSKIKINNFKMKKAGDIGPYKNRWMVEFNKK